MSQLENRHATFLYSNVLKIGIALIALASISGCETVGPDWQNKKVIEPVKQQPPISGELNSTLKQNNNQSTKMTERTEPLPSQNQKAQIFPGKQIKLTSAKGTPVSNNADFSKSNANGDIILNFVDTPIRDVLQIIMGDHLDKRYEIASSVQGVVNLNNSSGLTTNDLIPTLETLLSSIDAQLLEEADRYKVVPGAKTPLSFSHDNIEIIPLRYIDASEFAKILSGYQVSTTVIERGNLLVLNGPSHHIQQIRELVRSFDLNWLKGMSIGLFPAKNTSVKTLRGELLGMFGNNINKDTAGSLRIIAIERSNTIMVIAAETDSVQMVGDWVKRLDQIGNSTDQKFFIYRVQNGRAKDLAQLLEEMFGNTQSDPYHEGYEKGLKPEVTSQHNNSDFRVIADESTNSLIITGSSHYYHSVRQAMEQLDSTPLQVLVEARIMELTLSDDLQYGLEWFLNGSRANSNTTATLDFGNIGISGLQPGFSYIIERAGEVRAALNGLADDSRLKVLSSPSLMVLNNQTASILVGDEIPIPTRQAISNISPDAPIVNEIEYRDTGILLTVSPRVNSSGMVTMDINQEVSSVVNTTTSKIDAPTIQKRQINSTVSIRSGQTVVLGGLIRETNSERESGIPVLKNMPILGKLFSNTSTLVQRTELVVLITPRIITSMEDTTAITQEYQQKMIGLQPISLNKL